MRSLLSLTLLAVLAGGLLAGCAIEPRPFPESDNELGARPGLLTGPTGTMTLFCCEGGMPGPAPAPARGS